MWVLHAGNERRGIIRFLTDVCLNFSGLVTAVNCVLGSLTVLSRTLLHSLLSFFIDCMAEMHDLDVSSLSDDSV